MDPDSSQSIYTPGGAVLEHRWLGQAIMPLLEQITQPTLILHPREDDIADINNAFFLQRNLRDVLTSRCWRTAITTARSIGSGM